MEWRDKRRGGSTATGATAELLVSHYTRKHQLSLHTSSVCSSWNCYRPLSFQAPEAISVSAQMGNLRSDPQTQSSGDIIKRHPNAAALSSPQWRCCRHSCATEAGQRVMQVRKILRSANCLVTVLCTVRSGIWLQGVAILSSLPWAVKATKMFVLEGCPGKSAGSGLFLYQVCQILYYMWHTFFFFCFSSLPNYST